MAQNMSYYEWICANDIIEHLRPLLENRGFRLRERDGKLYRDTVISWDTPWHHVKHAWGKDCLTWHQIIFDYVVSKLPEQGKFVPANCQNCWKTVVRPKTLYQLFALLELQKRLQIASKCGIEVRQTVCGLYGGYFYTNSWEEGLAVYQIVRQAVNDDEKLGKDTKVILKRGCTEMEAILGDSRKWHTTPDQLALEETINRYLVRDESIYIQPEHVLWHIHRRWIEWAYQNGDETYLHFTGGKPLYAPYVTYHHLVGASDEEVRRFFTGENAETGANEKDEALSKSAG